MRYSIVTVAICFGIGLAACDRSEKPGSAAKSPTPVSARSGDDHEHETGDGHNHSADRERARKDEAAGQAGHGAEAIELGTTKLGELSVRASRDKGEIKAGGDAPIDAWIDGGVGKGVTAVRFWIGTQDAKGSIKAKAEIEDGKWHTHVEVPDPLPAEGKLWVEVESTGGTKQALGFDLRP